MRQKNHKPGPGRTSKGARKPFMTRLPKEFADAVEQEAEARDLSYSEYIAIVVAQAHGSDVPMPPRLKPTSTQMQLVEVPTTAAS